MALEYRQVKDIYDTLHDAGVVTTDLPDWSTEMNRLSGSDLYSAGLHDNLIKRASVGIDRLLEKTGLPNVTEAFGRSVGETVGAPESGARIGRGLPRTTLNFAPFLIPGAGWGAGAARLGLTGLLSGAETYTETGSPAAGLLSGGTVAAFPGIVGGVERAAARAGLGPVARFLTGQGAIAGVSQASEFGQQAIAGEPLSVHPTDMLLNLTLGQLPFAGTHLLRKGFGLDQHAVDTATKTIEQRQAQTNLDNKTPVEKVPEDLTPEVVAKTKLTLSRLRGEQVSIKDQIAAGTLTPEDGLEATNKLLSQEAEVLKRPEVLSGQTVFGDSIQPESPRTEVLGKELRRTAKWRAIRVSDDEANPPELRGKVVGYSTAYEPDPVQGLQTLESGTAKYSLPGPQWWTIKSQEEWASRFKKPVEGQVTPELPVQPTEATPEQYYSHLADLKKVEVDADTAQSPADLQAAVVRLNSVEHENDLPPTNDSTLAKSAKVIEQAGVEPQDVAKVAVKARAKKVARILRDQQTARPTEKVDKDNATLNDAVAHAEVIASQPDEPAHAAFKDDLDILMSVAQTRRDAKYAFDSWTKQHPEVKTDFQTESERFQLFKVLRWRKIIGEGEKLSDSDLEEFQSELKKAEIAPDNPEELRDFPDRLYVREWDDAINERLKSRQDVNTSPIKPVRQPLVLEGESGYIPTTEVIKRAKELVGSEEFEKQAQQRINNTPATSPGTQAIAIERTARKIVAQDMVSHGEEVIAKPGNKLLEEINLNVEGPLRAPGNIPFLPDTPEDVSTMSKLGDNGTSAVAFLAKSENPAFRALAKDLSKFGDTLNRIEVRVAQTQSGTSAAYDLGNNQTRIVISHAALDQSHVLEFHLAHELVHGLTLSELNNPTKADLVAQFADIRQRLINSLPKRMQDRLNELSATNWRGQYSSGKADFESIIPGGVLREKLILYSLLNTKELVAQGLSSRPFQDFMRSVKSGRSETWFSRFTETVRNLLGLKVEGSVFEEFLSKTDQLLEHGNFVSSFSEFSEHYFEGLGMTSGLVQANTRRALGVILNSGFGTSTHEVINQIADTGLVRSSEFALAQRDATKMFQQKGEPFELTSQVMDELGYTPDQRGLDNFTHESLMGLVSNHADALEMLPDEAAKYVTAKVKDMQNILGVLKAATNEKNTGLLNLADPVVIRGPVREASRLVDRLLEHERNTQEGQRIVNDLHGIAPDVYADRMVAQPDLAPEFLRDDLREEKVGVLKRFLGTAAQLSRSDPVTAEYFERGAEIDKNRREMHRAITKVMGIDLLKGGKDLSKEGLKESVKVVENPRLEAVINKWMYWDNEVARKEGRGVTMLPDSHPEIAKILSGLSAADRQAIIDTRAKTVAMTQVAQVKELEKRAQFSIARAAMVAVRDGGVKPADAIATTGRLWQAVTMDRTDPVKAQQADALIRSVQQSMSAEGLIDLSNIVLNAVEQHKLYSDFYAKNPAWATAQRQERWLVEYRRGNKIVQNQGSSKKEVLEKAKGAVITKEPWDQYAQDSDKYIAPSLSEESFNRLKELETSQNDMLRKVLSPEQMQEVERTSLVTQFAREQAARVGQIPRFRTPARQLSKGADELPWLWNHFAWSDRMSNYWTRQLFRAQADLEIANPELQARPDLLDLVKAHKEQVLSPDPKLIRQVNRFTTTWYLSSLASPLINGFQTLTTMVPELTRLNGGRWLNSYSRWKDAVAEVSAAGIARKEWVGEHKQLIQDARVAGEVDRSMWDEDAATQDSVATRWQQMMSKNKVQTLGQRADSLMGATSTAGLWLFKQPEKFNRLVALLTGFDLAKEKGMSYEDAKTEAFRFNRAVNYGGGKINRPIGLFDKMPRSFAMLATNLQGYNLGVMSQLFRHIQDGYFRPAELKPGEIHAARKAALQMLGTQFVMAGTLGMPFVSGVVALLDKAFPGLEVNKHLREWMSSLFNEDDSNGHVLSDIAMTGLPSMMGWDMQSRLSVGNLVPGVSEYNGFQPELLLGPPMSLASTYLNGLGRVAMGDPKGAEAFIPPGIKKLFQLGETGGVVKDYRGRPLFTPSVGETAGIALGFQPKRLSDFNAADRIAKQNQDVTTRREGQFRQGLAEDVLKGNFGTVAQTLRSRVDAEPNYDVAEAVRAVARAAEEMTFPRDLRREGSARQAPDRQRLLNAFNLSASQPSEVARLQFRQQVEKRLGLRSTGNRSEVVVAQLMDQLRGQNPDAPRAELRRQAELFLRRQRISTLLPALPTPAQ